MYSSYGIAFDEKREWSFANDFARNVIMFSIDNSSSFHTDNHQKKFLILRGSDTFSINGNFGAPEK